MTEEELHHKTELSKKIKEGPGDDSDDEDADDEDDFISHGPGIRLLARGGQTQSYADAFKDYSFLHINLYTPPPKF